MGRKGLGGGDDDDDVVWVIHGLKHEDKGG